MKMLPGVNPRQAAKMMKRMGIQQQEIEATEVIIKTPEKTIIITNPSVSKVNMMGQETFQVMGEVTEQENSQKAEINQEDIKTVMEQTNVSEAEAREAIEKAEGDLAKAILNLKQ
jgi:nascent polypeptide-associated complex subunit alpha